MAKEKFENKMNRLEEIITNLDGEDVDLDESIKLYEEGLKLSKDLKKQLETFKEKIENINKENGNE